MFPLRALSFVVFKPVAADLVFLTTFSATYLPVPTAFSEAALVVFAAFLLCDLAFSAPFLAACFALAPTFFAARAAVLVALDAVALVLLAALAADETFFATAAESPAFWRSPRLAFASLATVPNFAAVNFFAVAAPTPGNDVMPAPLAFLDMDSPS